MSKHKKKDKKSKSGPTQNLIEKPKHVLSKSKVKIKQGKNRKKMSDHSSEVSSNKSSGKSGSLTAPSSAPSSSSTKKRQCDLCKLSYSSDKELTEHLVSLMHHTKLENKDENAVHNCVLCKTECKNMADYRKHIGLRSHVDEVARLKGEKVEKKKKIESRWENAQDVNGNQSRNNNNDKFSGNSFMKQNNILPWNNIWNQGHNVKPWVFNQLPPPVNFWGRQEEGRGLMSWDGRRMGHGYQSHNVFPMNNNSNHWVSNQGYGQGSFRNSRGQKYEPWGSGMYRDGQRPFQYDRGGHYQNDRNLQGHSLFEHDQYGHWDEHSLRMQEQFLASMEENNEGKSRHGEQGQDSSMNVDVDHHGNRSSVKWGSGAMTLTNTSSTEDLRGAEVLETNVAAVVDRKRPIQDNEPEEDGSCSAARKTFRSHDLPQSKTSPSKVKVKYGEHRQVSTTSSSSKSATAELDNASDDLLQRAERLCKELREKRLASATTRTNKINSKQQETILNQKLDAISQQRQQKYFKGLITDGQDLSSGDSGISSGRSSQVINKHKSVPRPGPSESNQVTHKSNSAQQKTLGEIRKSLETTVPPLEDKETNISQRNQKGKEKNSVLSEFCATSPPISKQGLAIPQRERRDSSSSTGSKQLPKTAARSQILTKDSLKKMINAPRSRDERVHLAKLLQSRDDAHHKPSAGTGTSRPLQLEGLYDSQTLDIPSTPNEITSTIKLEDLGAEVREQILSLIGSSCSGLEELQLPLSGSPIKSGSHLSKSAREGSTVLSDTEGSVSHGKKQDKASLVKKKSDLDSENIKKKAKKKVVGAAHKGATASKDSRLVSKSTSLGGPNTDCDKAQKTKTKSKPVEGKSKRSSLEAVINLVDSEDELRPSQDGPVVKDKTPKKKKKKKKDDAREGQGSQVSSSLESDDVSTQIPSSGKPSKFLPRSQLAESPRTKPRTDLEGEAGFSNETSQESLSETCSNRQDKELDLLSKTSPVKSKTSSSYEKAISTQEQSLNRQNVREKFPILMNSLNKYAFSPMLMSSPEVMSSSKHSADVTVSNQPSSTSRPYAKAIAMPLSTSSPSSLSLSQSAASNAVSLSPTAEPSAVQRANLQLPPSIHLANRSSQSVGTPTSLETQPIRSPGNVHGIQTKSEKDTEGEISGAKGKLLVVMDDSDGGAGPGEDDVLSLTSSAYSGDASSQAMTALLSLSEREEQIKQEAMSMELRLTRLHRLLEQAVVQINKCTERRTQLQKEEKEISMKRLTLLRGAAKGKSSCASSSSTQNSTAAISGTDVQNAEASADDNTPGPGPVASLPSSYSSATTTSTSATSPSPSTTSLSRADWLAKFASFLPPDPTQEQDRQAALRETRSASAPDCNTGGRQSCGESSTSANISHLSAPDGPASINKATSSASTQVMKGLSCMYVGSFLSPGTPVSKRRPSLSTHGKGESTVSVPSTDSICHIRESGESHRLFPGTITPLADHGVRLQPQANGGTGDDSDIGSVASSLASGTSLGEQISQYCRATPGASLDPPVTGPGLRGGGAVSRQQLPDLSVILSSDASLSDHHNGSNQRGEEEEESQYPMRRGREREAESDLAAGDITRPSSVTLRLEVDRRGIYGSLNQEAVRSAEALHVMERNYQEETGNRSQEGQKETEDCPALFLTHSPNKGSTATLSDCTGSGGGKRKKLLTRQEREASQLTRHRKRWLVSSSSSDEEEGKKKETEDNTDVINVEGDIVVAECDSSTGLGIVDSESVRQRTETLREMRQSFERTFGRSPRMKAAPLREGDSGVGINSTTTETSSHVSKSALPERLKRASDFTLTYDSRSEPESSLADEARDTGLRRFEGGDKSVCGMQVVDNHLYVGYQNSGISVFDLQGDSEEKISEHPFRQLWCFCVTEINEVLTVIVGNGPFLTFCSANETQIPTRDMGSPICCILCSNFELFLGLDTGEICVFNTKTMDQRLRFICSDHSLQSLAVAQEGMMKLLCVAALDGSISVVNARQGLLLRILPGHIKTVLSLQVDKSSVFSSSMDGMVLEQNLHTTTVEHVYKDHKGIVMAVHLYKNFLLTAGEDKLVRCFDVKTHKLVQVNYGAERGVVSKIIVLDDKLITGNLNGVVDVIDFNIDAQNKCPVRSCKLNFGHRTHLQWHQLQEKHFENPELTPIILDTS